MSPIGLAIQWFWLEHTCKDCGAYKNATVIEWTYTDDYGWHCYGVGGV